MAETIHLVREVECGHTGKSEPLRAFDSRDAAESWREEHIAEFEWDDDREAYHVGMGAYRNYPIVEIPFENTHS